MTSKAQETKENTDKSEYQNLQLYATKDTINTVKR